MAGPTDSPVEKCLAAWRVLVSSVCPTCSGKLWSFDEDGNFTEQSPWQVDDQYKSITWIMLASSAVDLHV